MVALVYWYSRLVVQAHHIKLARNSNVDYLTACNTRQSACARIMDGGNGNVPFAKSFGDDLPQRIVGKSYLLLESDITRSEI